MRRLGGGSRGGNSAADGQAEAAVELLALSRAAPENRAAVLAANGPSALVQLLRSSRGSRSGRGVRLQQSACEMLSVLALSGSTEQAAVAAAGAIPELAHLLRSSRDAGVQAAAAEAVSRLTADNPGNAAAAADKPLKCIRSLLHLPEHSSSEAVQRHAAAALVHLAHHVGDAAARTHAIPVFMGRLFCDSPLEQRHAALALAAVVETDSQADSPRADAILRRRGVGTLVGLLQEGDEQVVPAAALVLQKLITRGGAAAAVEAGDGRVALLLHAGSANPDVQQAARAVLRLLDSHAASQPAAAAAATSTAAQCASVRTARRTALTAGAGRQKRGQLPSSSDVL